MINSCSRKANWKSIGHRVPDYRCGDTVSLKVANIISSYIDQINRKVWLK